ncbi:hypothetical protein CYY_002126 [Polysphondylium violaceum]|uniref:Uncharacterized protein n=1 Tax=Polysphondylium violaceum TaxID=133409 RepID=A0A8J4V118_9MYCE|nr:hypothetical protein CYY_002126 [Polysphondylium violaceum]
MDNSSNNKINGNKDHSIIVAEITSTQPSEIQQGQGTPIESCVFNITVSNHADVKRFDQQNFDPAQLAEILSEVAPPAHTFDGQVDGEQEDDDGNTPMKMQFEGVFGVPSYEGYEPNHLMGNIGWIPVLPHTTTHL